MSMHPVTADEAKASLDEKKEQLAAEIDVLKLEREKALLQAELVQMNSALTTTTRSHGIMASAGHNIGDWAVRSRRRRVQAVDWTTVIGLIAGAFFALMAIGLVLTFG